MSLFGDLTGGITDLVAGNTASDIQRRAQRSAQQDLNTGYNTSLNLAAPMQQQSQQDYTNLSNQYGSGQFSDPTVTPMANPSFSYDPNSVFSDPEYQAQMTAGTNAITSSAAGKGMEFSGNTDASLQNLGQQTFANRSDDLYNRAYGQYTGDRTFNADQAQTAESDNAANNATAFNEGNTLAGYAPGALDTSINLTQGQAQANADSDLGVGAIRANAWNAGGKKLGQLAGTAGNAAANIAQNGLNLAQLGA